MRRQVHREGTTTGNVVGGMRRDQSGGAATSQELGPKVAHVVFLFSRSLGPALTETKYYLATSRLWSGVNNFD